MKSHDRSMHSNDPGRFERLVPDEGLVEQLVRLGNTGPEIPADGAEDVKAAIRPAWRREVRRRARRRQLSWAGALAVAATVMIAVGLAFRTELTQPVAVSTVATVTRVIRSVEVASPDGMNRALTSTDSGAEILAGSRLRTDNDSRIAIMMSGGQSLRLDTTTSARLLSDHILILERGAAYLDSGSKEAGGMEVHTAVGVAADIGTQFEVRQTEGVMMIRVREGLVLLNRAGEQLEIADGSQLTAGMDGPVQHRIIQRYGREWSWIQEVAPPFVIEGRSVADFLAWVSSETGLQVRFEEPATEAFAGETLLHGTLGEIAPLQAPELVLPSCGLSSRVEAGILIVGQMGNR